MMNLALLPDSLAADTNKVHQCNRVRDLTQIINVPYLEFQKHIEFSPAKCISANADGSYNHLGGKDGWIK